MLKKVEINCNAIVDMENGEIIEVLSVDKINDYKSLEEESELECRQ